MDYVRTSLPDNKKRELTKLASSQGLSVAAFIRALIYKSLEESKTK